jgi:hypothetical protein
MTRDRTSKGYKTHFDQLHYDIPHQTHPVLYLLYLLSLHNSTPSHNIMSDDWFSSKLAPEQENHPEEVEALKDYLRQKTTATEAAQAITRPVVTAECPRDDLSRLHILLLDALVELPDHTELLLALLQAIENLPEPDFTAVQPTKRPQEKLWKGLPHFANRWYDVSYRSGSWKMDAEAASGPKRDTLRDEHVRKAEVEARLVMAGLAGIPIDWGYEVIDDALGSDALLDFEVPAAAEWFAICGQRFRQGAEEGEKSYVLKDEGMSLKRWSLWEARLRELQAQSGAVQRAATKALNAIHEADREWS